LTWPSKLKTCCFVLGILIILAVSFNLKKCYFNEKYCARLEKTFQLLKSHNFSNIEHFKSGTEKTSALTLATIEILKQNANDEPILIVEDDIAVYKEIPETIDVDDNTDAFYLGLSMHGGHPRFNYNVYLGVDVVPKQNGLCRVYNMLGAHAIIYITQKYKLGVQQSLEKSQTKSLQNDVCISRIQKLFCVFCPLQPIFFQNDKCDFENSKATQIKFTVSAHDQEKNVEFLEEITT
jgi:hypothetical protein